MKRALAPAVVVLLPLASALVGSRGPHRVTLGLGPGDRPYVSGFAPEYEIDGGVATHWTTYQAGVALPLSVNGAPAAPFYRYARVFGETAQVEVRDGAGRTLDRFSARGGVWLERRAPVGVTGPLALAVLADSHERQDRGLKLDWIAFEAPAGSTLRLTGAARWQPALLVALLVLGLRLLGWGTRAAALLALPWAAVLGAGLLLDPWLVHRLLRGLPAALALVGLGGALVGRLLHARGRVEARTLRVLGLLAVSAFLLRAAAVNHPAFYYPDQRTHARLVEQLQKDGLRFLATPARSIEAHGVWRTVAYGRVHAFPYSPAFHLPFAALSLPYDTLLLAMKLAAAAVSVLPLLLAWAMARRIGSSTVAALLMLLVPTYTSRLSYAFFPSLFGHAVDMAFLYWLMGRAERLGERRAWLAGAAWVCACQLAYVSGVINTAVFVASFALVRALLGARPRLTAAAAVLAMGLLGALASLAVYYRDFLGMAADVARRAGGGGQAHYPVQSWWTVAYGRTRDFFDGVYPVLAAAGLFLLRRARAAPLLLAWALAYALLLLGRARVPDVFLHGHETLFATPLVCLAAAEALARLARFGTGGRVAAAALLAFLAAQGFAGQWAALAAQLGNAR